MVTIVDYGVGNLASIRNMMKKAGFDAVISGDTDRIAASAKLILPGVGAYDTCVEKLRQSGLIEVLNKKALEEKIPVLGVCVGHQLLFRGSEEGQLPGLGWVGGQVVKFRPDKMREKLKVPHMGWTDVQFAKPSRLFEDMYDEPRFYFVHSYYSEIDTPEDALVEADYGYPFVAGVEHENILGVQFHPEKSHKFGMKLFENFMKNY